MGNGPSLRYIPRSFKEHLTQIYHDICLENLPVIFAMDRGGVIGADGATHQGLYDIAFLRSMPNMVLCAASNEKELSQMLWTGLAHSGPFAVRYPRGAGAGIDWNPEEPTLEIGKAEVLREGLKIALLALGPMVSKATEAVPLLMGEGPGPNNRKYAVCQAAG